MTILRKIKALVVSFLSNPTVKRYLISSLTTFLTVFGATVAQLAKSGIISPETLNIAAMVGIFGVAARAAVKAVIELLIGKKDGETTI